MEIEEVAHTNPDALARMPIDPLVGVDQAKAREIVGPGAFPDEAPSEGAALLASGCGRCSSARTPPSSR